MKWILNSPKLVSRCFIVFSFQFSQEQWTPLCYRRIWEFQLHFWARPIIHKLWCTKMWIIKVPNSIDIGVNIFRNGLTFSDILPADPKMYDKMRPPLKDGKGQLNWFYVSKIYCNCLYRCFSILGPTIVYFHVTVMGLDSIDETSMVTSENYW